MTSFIYCTTDGQQALFLRNLDISVTIRYERCWWISRMFKNEYTKLTVSWHPRKHNAHMAAFWAVWICFNVVLICTTTDCLCSMKVCIASNKVSVNKASLFKQLKDAPIFQKWSHVMWGHTKLLYKTRLYVKNALKPVEASFKSACAERFIYAAKSSCIWDTHTKDNFL